MQFSYHEVFQIADETIKRIRKGELDPAKSLNNMIEYLQNYGMSNNTVLSARAWLFCFFQFAGLNLDMYDLNRAVKKLRRVYAHVNRLPTRDEVRSILLASDLRMKVFILMMISTGARPFSHFVVRGIGNSLSMHYVVFRDAFVLLRAQTGNAEPTTRMSTLIPHRIAPA